MYGGVQQAIKSIILSEAKDLKTPISDKNRLYVEVNAIRFFVTDVSQNDIASVPANKQNSEETLGTLLLSYL